MFIKGAPNSHGYVDTDSTLRLWSDTFTYFYDEHEWSVFPLTIHPDTAGRPHVLLMLEKFIQFVNKHDGVEWCTMEEVNRQFREREPVPEGAIMPKGQS